MEHQINFDVSIYIHINFQYNLGINPWKRLHWAMIEQAARISVFMPPTLKKLEGHIAFGLSVCLSVRV